MDAGFDSIAEQEFDVVVLGGGLTGAAVAREAAGAGARVLLVEPVDFGWGSSGRSCRLGIASLPLAVRRNARLFHAALGERSSLARAARHLVRVVPALDLGDDATGLRRRLQRLRERLTRRVARAPGWPAPRTVAERQLSALLPGIEIDVDPPVRIVFDAVIDDRRLALATALDARRAGAELAPRCDVVGLESAGDGRAWLELRDRIGGATAAIKARAVVNATGAWIDRVRRMYDVGGGRSLFTIGRSARASLPLPIEAALIVPHPRDGRAVTIAPGNGTALFATPHDDLVPGADAAPPPEDEPAFLEDIARALAGDAGPLRAGFSQARALADRPGLVRETAGGAPFWSIVAGHPLFARVAARQMAARLQSALGAFDRARARTRGFLPGGDLASIAGEAGAARARGLSPRQARWLVERYGSAWSDVIEGPGAGEPLGDDEVPLRGEVAYAQRHEAARTLSDLLLRWRAPELLEPLREQRLAEAALSELARQCGWSDVRAGRERVRWQRERALLHGDDAGAGRAQEAGVPGPPDPTVPC